MKVAILHARISAQATKDELDTLAQVEAVGTALRSLGHETCIVELSLQMGDFLRRIRELRPDLVFNLIESLEGQGQFLYSGPMLLDYLELPYTGSNTASIFATSNKLLSKKIFQGADIPTAPWSSLEDALRGGPSFAGPYIIKSVWEHASVGLDENSIIEDSAQVARALIKRGELLGGQWFAEKFLAGREFNQAMLAGTDGPVLLPTAEMRFENFPGHKAQIVDYRAKWEESSFEYANTVRNFEIAPADQSLIAELQRLARRCWEIFELRGYARVDFRCDAQGKPWVLEVNANPCISPDSGFVAAANRAGISYSRVVQSIIEDLNWNHYQRKAIKNEK